MFLFLLIFKVPLRGLAWVGGLNPLDPLLPTYILRKEDFDSSNVRNNKKVYKFDHNLIYGKLWIAEV